MTNPTTDAEYGEFRTMLCLVLLRETFSCLMLEEPPSLLFRRGLGDSPLGPLAWRRHTETSTQCHRLTDAADPSPRPQWRR